MKLILEIPPTSYECCIPTYAGIECDSKEELYLALVEAINKFLIYTSTSDSESIKVLGRRIDISAFFDDDGNVYPYLDQYILTLDEFFESVREDGIIEGKLD